ncbi:MAG: MFS transporter [Gammaproteobacteria bacterium]
MKKASRYMILLPWFICSLGALFYSYEYLLRIIPSVITDDLERFFHIHNGTLGNLSAFYYYVYTPMQLVVGVLMDRYGPRRLLTMASLCCVVGSFLFAFKPILWMAEVGRFLVGFGSAFAFVGVLKLATVWLPSRYFAMFSGIATALGMLGAIVGNILMTGLVESFGWQATVYGSGAFGILVALLIVLFVRDENLERHKAMQKPKLVLSQVIENLYLIIKKPQMWLVGTIGGLLYLSTSAFAEMWGNPYLRAAHGLNAEQAAIAVSMIFAGWVAGGPFCGWLSDTVKRRCWPLTVNALIAAAIITIVLFVPNLSTYVVYSLLFAFGFFSGIEVITFAIGKEMSSSQASGSAVAFVNMVVMLSGVIFQPLIGYLLDALLDGKIAGGVQIFTLSNYQVALTCLPFALIISAVLSHFFLKETFCKTVEVLEEEQAEVEEIPLVGSVLES